MSDSDDSIYVSDDDERVPIVLDLGSFMHRAGFGGDDQPKFVTRSVISEPQVVTLNLFGGGGGGDAVIGDEAFAKRLPLKYPVVDGRVDDMEAMEKLISHTFKHAMRVVPSDHPVLLNMRPRCHNHDKEDITEMMFEKLKIPSLYLGASPSLAVMSTGRLTGIVVDCGWEKSIATPCYELHAIPHASKATTAASKTIEDNIVEKVGMTSIDYRGIEDIVKDHCKIYPTKAEFEKEIKEDMMPITITGIAERLDIAKDLLRVSEGYFQTSLLGMKEKTLTKIVINAIAACDPELKWELLGNVILSGGGSMMTGMQERLQAELQEHYKAEVAEGKRVKVIAAPQRDLSVWVGGSTLSSLSYFDDMLITTAEYEECGPYIARRKCFA